MSLVHEWISQKYIMALFVHILAVLYPQGIVTKFAAAIFFPSSKKLGEFGLVNQFP